MLIMNQNHDAVLDTTNALIRIDNILGSEGRLCYRVSGYIHGMRATISEHDTLEDAKKALDIIRYAMISGATTCNFDDDVVNNLDTVISGFKTLLGENDE